jgi:hypothetical protein
VSTYLPGVSAIAAMRSIWAITSALIGGRPSGAEQASLAAHADCDAKGFAAKCRAL